MRSFPLPPPDARDAGAFLLFLEERRAESKRLGVPVLVSITLPVSHLEPLAVLEAIHEGGEPHFYAERPERDLAVAAAEPVALWEGSGPGRFADGRRWLEGILEHAVAVGPLELPFAGPTFFGSFSFAPEVGAGPFPAARLFVPRWQVARCEGAAVAVANVLVTPDLDVPAAALRILRAQGKFSRFDYDREDAAPQQPETSVSWKLAGGTERSTFEASVARAERAIRAGEFEKIVLARRLVLERTGGGEARTDVSFGLLDRLRRRFPSCWTLSVGSGTGAVFLAATPERLVRVTGQRVETAAIAGTAPRGEGAAADARLGRALLESDKDLREHRLVIASIERRLREVGVEPRTPPVPRLLTLANVQHLHTPITGELPEGRHLLDVLGALHPTPAMGGRPRDVVLPQLRGFEDFDRGLYAGPLGWVRHNGDGEFVVGIRGGVFDAGRGELYAGVGIVAGSDPAGEWRETEWKLNAMREALGA